MFSNNCILLNYSLALAWIMTLAWSFSLFQISLMQSVNGEQHNKTINITFLFLLLGAAAVPVSSTVILL